MLQLNGARLYANVPAYPNGSALVVRWLVRAGTLPASGKTDVLVRIGCNGGTVGWLDIAADSGGNLIFAGYHPDGSSMFNSGVQSNLSVIANPVFVSVEVTPVSGGQQFSIVTLRPGSVTANGWSTTMASAVRGQATQLQVNPPGFFTDTAFGHLHVQNAQVDVTQLSDPLNAHNAETAASRFARLCTENDLPCRVLGAPALSLRMGPQSVDTLWNLLQECQAVDMGLMYDSRDARAIGFRTLKSMLNQSPRVTLDYAKADLPGDLAPAEDTQDFVNDWTVTRADGSSARAVLADGSPASTTDPAQGGIGVYASSQQVNVGGDDQLADEAGWRLFQSSIDEARFRQVSANAGIPGAPVADLAALRPGDLIEIRNPPAVLQTDVIRQIVTGAEETLGPGRALTWDCQPGSAYDTLVLDDPVGGLLDTDGSELASAAAAGALPQRWDDNSGWGGWGGTNAAADGSGGELVIASTGAGAFWQGFGPSFPVVAGQTVAVVARVTAAQALGAVSVGIHLSGGSDSFTASAAVAVAAGQTMMLCATATAAAGQTAWGVYIVDSESSPAGYAMTASLVYGGIADVLSVATTGPSGILWDPNSTAAPYDVSVGGERCTVAKVTGASSPQSMTVIRGAGGASIAHASGAAVRLWRRNVLSMI